MAKGEAEEKPPIPLTTEITVKKTKNPDDVIDRGKRNQRFGDGAAGMVFVYDGQSGSGGGSQGISAEDKSRVDRKMRQQKHDGKNGGYHEKGTDRLHKGNADDLLAGL